MSRNPRIEEVSDSDSDPPEADPSDFLPSNDTLIRPSSIPSSSNAAPPSDPRAQYEAAMASARAQREATKHYQCLYPLYFDSLATRRTGRRVPRALASPSPLARSIIDALQDLGLGPGSIVFEPGKTHPRDWANPGRVRVLLPSREAGSGQGQGGKKGEGEVRSKDDLILHVARWLKEHPATEEDTLRYKMGGLPAPKDGKAPSANVPRGWKLGKHLPLHSPALTGGGVSEDMFKDMMREMSAAGGQGGGGGPEQNALASMANMFGGMGGMSGLLGGGGAGGGSAAGQGQGAQKKVKDKGKRK